MAANLSVPVINCSSTATALDKTVYNALRSLNVPALRERLAKEIENKKVALQDADAAIRN